MLSHKQSGSILAFVPIRTVDAGPIMHLLYNSEAVKITRTNPKEVLQ